MLKTIERFQAIFSVLALGAGGAWYAHEKLGAFATREEISSIKAESVAAIDERYRVSIDLMKNQQDEIRRSIDSLVSDNRTIRADQISYNESTRLALRSLNDKLFQLATMLRQAENARTPAERHAVLKLSGY